MFSVGMFIYFFIYLYYLKACRHVQLRYGKQSFSNFFEIILSILRASFENYAKFQDGGVKMARLSFKKTENEKYRRTDSSLRERQNPV